MPKYNLIPHPMHDAEFHVFHRMIFLCEIPRDWSGLVSPEFLDTTVMFCISYL